MSRRCQDGFHWRTSFEHTILCGAYFSFCPCSFLGSAMPIISAFLMVNLVHWATGAGLGLGFPGLQLGFGAGAGCGVGVGFGYGLGKGRAYDYDHTYSNVGRLPRRSNSVTGSSGWVTRIEFFFPHRMLFRILKALWYNFNFKNERGYF